MLVFQGIKGSVGCQVTEDPGLLGDGQVTRVRRTRCLDLFRVSEQLDTEIHSHIKSQTALRLVDPIDDFGRLGDTKSPIWYKMLKGPGKDTCHIDLARHCGRIITTEIITFQQVPDETPEERDRRED